MSGMSGANYEVTPQSPLRPGPQTPHSISREAGSPARHGFQEDQQVRLPPCPYSRRGCRSTWGRKNRHVRVGQFGRR
jgi:hypothetical protein